MKEKSIMAKNDIYQKPMLPWPELSSFAKMIDIETMEMRLFLFESGIGNNLDIIMVHGLGDEADTWRHVFKPLSENYHTIAIDLPGYGRSDKPRLAYTPTFMMKAILEVLNHFGIEKAILMGSSLGGILSHGLALLHRDRIKGLILVDGALIQDQLLSDWTFRLMQIPILGEWLYTRLRKDPDAAFNSLRNVYRDLASLPKPDREFLYKRVNKRVWSNGQRRAYFSTLRNLTPWIKTLQKDLPDKLSQLDIPTLILRGEEDTLFPEGSAKLIAVTQPHSIYHPIENAGHLPQQENPELFLNKINEWLSQNF